MEIVYMLCKIVCSVFNFYFVFRVSLSFDFVVIKNNYIGKTYGAEIPCRPDFHYSTILSQLKDAP